VNTFSRNLQLAALENRDSLQGLVALDLRVLLRILDNVDKLFSLENFAKDNVAAIEPSGDGSGDEKLAAVGVLARIGHAEKVLLGVLELEILIGELGSVDGLSAGA
jgi:hypothetical protein